MESRVKRIQVLFKDRFGIDLKEHELYGNLAPRLTRQMDKFLDDEISDNETINLVDYLSEKLHGKALLKEKEPISNKINNLEDSPQIKVPNKKRSK